MPRPKMTQTRYSLPLGATLLISVWTNGEMMIEGGVDGSHALGALVRAGQSLKDARPVIHSPDTTTPANVAALGELLTVVAEFLNTGRIDRGLVV